MFSIPMAVLLLVLSPPVPPAPPTPAPPAATSTAAEVTPLDTRATAPLAPESSGTTPVESNRRRLRRGGETRRLGGSATDVTPWGRAPDSLAPPPIHPFTLRGPLGPTAKVQGSFVFYGMLVVNAGYNSGTPFPTQDAPIGAQKGSLVGEGLSTDGAFIITPRQSRFGGRGQVEISERTDLAAQIELDFFGLHEDSGPGGVGMSAPRLRLAFAEIGGKRVRFVVGQTWSVVTPRLPTSIGHSAIALHTFAGAVWNRLPQLTLSVRERMSEAKLSGSSVSVQLSAVRSVSADGFGGFDCPAEVASPPAIDHPAPQPPPSCRIVRFDTWDPGSLSRFPAAQMHVGFDSDALSLGVGGHAGAEAWFVTRSTADGDVKVEKELVPSWMASLDAKVQTKWFWIMGQGYVGANLNGMNSRQGVREYTWSSVAEDDPRFGTARSHSALPTMGGWLELGIPLGTDRVKLVGSAAADVGRRSAVAPGQILVELGAFAGLVVSPHPNVDASLEYVRNVSVYRAGTTYSRASTRGFNDNATFNVRVKF